MSALDDVRALQQQGLGQDQIIQTLRNNGVSYQEISEALSQSQIKAAVEAPTQTQATALNQAPSQTPAPIPEAPTQSIIPPQQNLIPPSPGAPQLSQTRPEPQAQIPIETTQEVPSPVEQPPPIETAPQFSADPYQDYDAPSYDSYDYDQYGGGEYGYDEPSLSSDTITEISEQIVAERMSDMRRHLEKVMDFKTVVESKIESIDERLKHLEQTIHTLQNSVLQKVGEYTTNVADIKQELIETQKSFSKVIPSLGKTTGTRKKKVKR